MCVCVERRWGPTLSSVFAQEIQGKIEHTLKVICETLNNFKADYNKFKIHHSSGSWPPYVIRRIWIHFFRTLGCDANHTNQLFFVFFCFFITQVIFWVRLQRCWFWTPGSPPPEPLPLLSVPQMLLHPVDYHSPWNWFLLSVCLRASTQVAIPPLIRRTVSVASASCARYSFHASFVASQPRLINKTPLLFFFLLLSTGTSAPWRVSAVRQAGGEGLKGNRSTSVNRSIGLIAPRLIGKWRILTWSDNGWTVCPSVCLWRN